MKKLLVLIALVCCLTASAQKPTGGCDFVITLTGIPPSGSPYVLYNGQSYIVQGSVYAPGCEPAEGKIDVKMGETVIGTQQNDTGWNFTFGVPILFDHFAKGNYSLEVIFTPEGSSGCFSSWKADVSASIQDSAKTDSVKQDSVRICDSSAVKPLNGGELLIYPVPASGYISINGLRSTETTWVVTVTSAGGRPVPMPAGKLLNGVVTISTLHLPQGRYYLHFQTRERTVGGTIEILR